MLVYGDRCRFAAPEALLGELARRLAQAGGDADRLTGALILAGGLAQGVADAEAEAAGHDDVTPAQDATLAVAIAVAARLLAACGQGAKAAPDPDAALARARALPLPSPIRCRSPESFAFYALYPEIYAAAAAAATWTVPPLVIGIRSIGASLAAVVAARLGCEALTVRPVGHPLRRELHLSEALAARLRRHAGAFIVVDEGPGLSGSSFGSVGDTLEALDVPPGRIVFMPSHPNGLGPHASPAHRQRWERARRLPAVGGVDAAAVRGWFTDLLGRDAGVEDLSGGGWRRDLPGAEWPPAAPVGERLKFRFTGRNGRFLARFAGLAEVGLEKFAVARSLHAAGFGPEPLALRRGFLLERWVEGTPLPAEARPGLVAHLGRYLGFRARTFPACGDGAEPAELRRMAVVNAGLLGGAALGASVERELGGMERLPCRPVRIDGRLHRWEWRQTPGGSILKTDAVDHAVAHDLVGCQDIAWDVAGAVVEFRLSGAETEELRLGVAEAGGCAVTREAVAAYRLCYAAFQGGLWRMMGEGGTDGERRIERQIERYRAEIRRAAALDASDAPPPSRSASVA